MTSHTQHMHGSVHTSLQILTRLFKFLDAPTHSWQFQADEIDYFQIEKANQRKSDSEFF